MPLPQIKTRPTQIDIPVQFSRLRDIAYNLWWTWTPQARKLFNGMDRDCWTRYRNPIELLIDMDPQRWHELDDSEEFIRGYRDLVERFPLIDELLVIDSNSSDRTRAIAEEEGARVVIHQEVLPRYGSYRGKGEALWKSLYETTGDLVVWADTDVKNWHPRMVYGTLGPLLHEPRLQYVKGYYQRPIVEGGMLKEGGGGRVTELVARPLINLFFPELSGLIQPLSGEYAGRRALLEQIPFFTGYAVEIGHLIDISERVGIEHLGQVDLERRVHRNQELEGLSRMSFVIMQAIMKRLEERRRVRLFAELGSTMKLPRSGKGRLGLEVLEIADQERPPMIRIPEYLERRTAAEAELTPLALEPSVE